ncbi:MAG TPA: SRPBCC domain-containing protein [Puia sp.]|jgi:uncharacterized protein YndB with AHSA1/START domain|nr:SRPBCC domain-containing protein [Puia sp.]
MEQKTKVHAEDGKQEILITRDFDLPIELLFRACTEPNLIEEWMGTQVVKMENRKSGSYQLQKTDEKGNMLFQAEGVIHTFLPNQKITRTFEMANTPFGVQLEIYVFESLGADTSRINMHVLYESVAQRDQVVQVGMTQGINWAHNRIQEVANKLK